jgi:hypothetical protein
MAMAGTSLGDPGQGQLEPGDGDLAKLEAYWPLSCVQNHAANTVPVQNGDLACMWFGGTQEGLPDVSICGSKIETRRIGVVGAGPAVG